MTLKRQKEIEAKAKEINDLSEQFQLIHATYATQEYIKDIAKDFYTQKLKDLKIRIQEKMSKDIDTSQEIKEKKYLESIIKQNLFHIDIGYIPSKNMDSARVIKINNSFTIYLSASLKNDIFKQDGTFNYKIISIIRKLMSHELGHLVLHTKELLQENSLQGSANIKDTEKEQEADLFGKTLLTLRKDRNKKINSDGGAENLF